VEHEYEAQAMASNYIAAPSNCGKVYFRPDISGVTVILPGRHNLLYPWPYVKLHLKEIVQVLELDH
jgi:hypothetical protein